MQRPSIMLRHEIPFLPGQASFDRIILDVLNRPTDTIGRIQKHLASWPSPRGMIRIANLFIAQKSPARLLQICDHHLGRVLVFADQDMHVIGHDAAGVASVFLARSRLQRLVR